jgi:hypothetical protein
MIGRVHNLLMDVEEENDRLERELASPSPARLTEYAIARESGDLTLRRIGRIIERLHLGALSWLAIALRFQPFNSVASREAVSPPAAPARLLNGRPRAD